MASDLIPNTAGQTIYDYAFASAGAKSIDISGGMNAQFTLRSGDEFKTSDDGTGTMFAQGVVYNFNNRRPRQAAYTFIITTLTDTQVLQVVLS